METDSEVKKDVEIQAGKLAFEYIRRDEHGDVAEIIRALDGISIEVRRGTFLAVLGHNGCGKSTFARHLNALLMPTEGILWVNGLDTAEKENTLLVRREVGMVFQNPDNQMIGTVVEEDVAFGLENLGIETAEIWNRVGKSLRKLGMENFRYSSPNKLSGGQKQKVAIAGIVAMQPGCIVLDEATSMLDPAGRKEVLEAVKELNQKEGITIILITHHMQEALYAEQAVVMEKGKIVMAGTPKEVFSQEEELKRLQLEVPPVAEIAGRLRAAGLPLAKGILTEQELITAIKKISRLPRDERNEFVIRAERFLGKKSVVKKENLENGNPAAFNISALANSGQMIQEQVKNNIRSKIPVLVLENVSYSYEKETGKEKKKKGKKRFGGKTEEKSMLGMDRSLGKSTEVPRKYAVDHISLSIRQGEFLALIGHTGSGKSTLLQLMNGLLKAEEGEIYYRGQDISNSSFHLPMLRHRIGLVFQYPEYQLFEATVVKDVMFGPKNQGLPQLQAQINTFEALRLAGIGEELFDISPFDLSGGQKRRVAIAGVLAMKPELMILDEPAAGLDPRSRRDLFSMLKHIHEETGMAVLTVSHSMEDAAEYADRILVMQEGILLFDDIPEMVFSHEEELKAAGLDIPEAARLIKQMRKEGIMKGDMAYTAEQAVKVIIHGLR